MLRVFIIVCLKNLKITLATSFFLYRKSIGLTDYNVESLGFE